MLKNLFEPWRQYWRILSGMRELALAAAMAVAVSGLFEVVSLLALVPVLNSVVTSGGTQGDLLGALLTRTGIAERFEIGPALIVFVAGGLLSVGLRLAGEALSLRIRSAVEQRMRGDMTDALLAIEWKYFVGLRQGEIAKAMLVEGNQVAMGARLFVAGIGTLLSALIFLAMAWLMSREMTLYTLLFGGVGAVVYLAASRPVRQHVEALSGILSSIGVRANDVFGNLKLFRATGRTEAVRNESDRMFREFAEANYHSQLYPPVLRALFEAAALVFIGGFLYWRIFIAGDAPATVLIFLTVFYRLAPKIMAVQDNLFQARTYLPWYETWRQRYEFSLAHHQPAAGRLVPEFSRSLEFDRVDFAYDAASPVLDEVTFALAPGECLAVVGASGCGKSTLLDLATGLLRPGSGRLSLDGQPLADYDREAWGGQIGFVPQECPLFHASVLGNIAWGDPSPDPARARECARQAHALEFIEAMPEGMQTPIGERGARLSGGQRQRLGIARALYRQPRLLVLDEATSALDGDAEEAVRAALVEMKGRVAILMVAHRLKTVALADRILVLKGGRVAETGTWEELMDRQGLFAEMARMQGIFK